MINSYPQAEICSVYAIISPIDIIFFIWYTSIMKTPIKNLKIRLRLDLYKAIKEYKQKTGVPMNVFIEKAIENNLKLKGRKHLLTID